MTTDTFSLDQCSVKFKLKPHFEHPRALKHVSVKAVHPLHGQIGSLEALQINRKRCRGEFFSIMDAESQEMYEFATTIFNDSSALRTELLDHEYHKGSGVWGREMDKGMLLYVLSVRVKDEVSRFHKILSPLTDVCA